MSDRSEKFHDYNTENRGRSEETFYSIYGYPVMNREETFELGRIAIVSDRHLIGYTPEEIVKLENDGTKFMALYEGKIPEEFKLPSKKPNTA